MDSLPISLRLATWRRRTDIPLLLIAVGSLPLLLLELIANRLSDGDQTFLTGVNVAVFVAFAVDYVVDLIVTQKRAIYVRTQLTTNDTGFQ